MTRVRTPRELEDYRSGLKAARDGNVTTIALCTGTGCLACGCEEVAEAFKKGIAEARLGDAVRLKLTGCPGFCERGPLAVIEPQGIFYQRIKPEDVEPILTQTVQHGQIVNKLLYKDPRTSQRIEKEADVPFYRKQMRLVLGRNGLMDPTCIDDYVLLGGYAAAAKALTTMAPDAIIEEIKASGLRGRGGGGFPAPRGAGG